MWRCNLVPRGLPGDRRGWCWCDDDNDDEGGHLSSLNVKSRNIEKHSLIYCICLIQHRGVLSDELAENKGKRNHRNMITWNKKVTKSAGRPARLSGDAMHCFIWIFAQSSIVLLC